jgi:acetyl esterase/lipase
LIYNFGIMSSLVYQTEMQVLRWFGHKRVFGLSEPELRRWLARGAKRRFAEVPQLVRLRHRVRDLRIEGRPCAVVGGSGVRGGRAASGESGVGGAVVGGVGGVGSIGGSDSISGAESHGTEAPVVLFLHGGGFIFEALFAHWLAVDRLVRKTGAEVWLPAYPLLPEATVYESHDMVLATWRQMRACYKASEITVLGDSAGATLALTLAHALKAASDDLPQQLIVLSPAQSRVAPELREQMAAFADNDVMIPLSLLDVLEQLMPERPDTPPWLLRPLEGDFGGFPATTVFCGTSEVFYPLMPDFLQRLMNAGVDLEFVSGEGMCHIWPYVPVAPESLYALDRIIARIENVRGLPC